MQEKKCKITLYIDTPGVMLRPDISKKEHLSTWFSGHTFIGLTDSKGNESRVGFSPDKQFQASVKCVTGCPGSFLDQSHRSFDEAIVYPISQEKYNELVLKMLELNKNPPQYKLLSINCATVAADLLRIAEVDRPNKMLSMTPMGLAFKKRALLMAQRTKLTLETAKSKIVTLFGGKSVPVSELLQSLQDKPKAVPIKEAQRACKNKEKLQDSKVLQAILPKICR